MKRDLHYYFSAEKAGASFEAEAREDLRMMKWISARDKIGEAHNLMISRVAAEGGPGLLSTPYTAAREERTAAAFWLAACNFDELPGVRRCELNS